MSWSDRMKRAFLTFKRMVLPLYAWYILFAIIGVLLVVLSFTPFLVSLIQNDLLDSGISGLPIIPGIPGFPIVPEIPGTPSIPGVPDTPFPGPYPNPNPPTPPGQNFNTGAEGFVHEIAPLLTFAPQFLLTFLALILLSWFLTSFFMTGVFNLTKKAYSGQTSLRDFRMHGFARVMGWYGLLTLLVTVLIGIGAMIAFSLREINYAIPIFAGGYTLILIAVGILLAPWLSISVFYMLNHSKLSFGSAFRGSWSFYRRHTGSFWGYFLTAIAIQILVAIIDNNSQNLGWVASVIATPFTTLLPIVWVLSHEEEEHPPIEHPPLEHPPYTSDSEILTTPMNGESPVTKDFADPPAQEQRSNHDCGHNPQPNNAQDNPSSYTPRITSEEDTINFCPTCGKSVRPGASYCSQCGTKL